MSFARRSEIAHDRRVEDRPEVDGAGDCSRRRVRGRRPRRRLQRRLLTLLSMARSRGGDGSGDCSRCRRCRGYFEEPVMAGRAELRTMKGVERVASGGTVGCGGGRRRMQRRVGRGGRAR